MFDIGFIEILVVFIVALLVIGPERLPHAARVSGKYFGKIKSMVNGVRVEVERELRADEMKGKLLRELEEFGVTDAKQQIEDTFKHGSVKAEDFKSSLEKQLNGDSLTSEKLASKKNTQAINNTDTDHSTGQTIAPVASAITQPVETPPSHSKANTPHD